MTVQPFIDLKLDLRNIIFANFEKSYGRQQNVRGSLFDFKTIYILTILNILKNTHDNAFIKISIGEMNFNRY